MADTTLTIIQSAPEASVEVAVQPADQLNVTIEQGARGDRGLGESLPIDASDVNVGATPLDDYLDDNLTRRVGAFATDFDPTGAFTTVPLLDVGEIPRAYLTGATILVVEGDHLGLWTVPASGPGTVGPDLAPGDVIASQSGRTATAYTVDGSTVAGVRVSSVAVPVDAWAIADQRAQAEVTTAPTKWARCGAPIPTNNGHFATSWTIPTPTTSFRVRALVRDLATDLGDDGDDGEYHEYASESLDGLGVGDRYECASETRWTEDFRARVKDYAESTAFGETEEWHKANGEDPALAPTTSGIWIEKEWEWDLTAETLTTRYRSDMLGTYVDADDGTRWAVTQVRSHPGLASIADTAGEDSWIGMGHGLFHIARVRRWVDGTLVSDFDASSAAADDTTVDDAVAEVSPGVPVVWTGVDLAIIEEAAAGGLELGETSTTAFRGDRGKTAYDHSQLTTGNPHSVTASQVGAPPTSRLITAGTGLTGGGDLSADRTLAVTYGLAASTAAEGIAVQNTPWRSGSFYGPTAPRVANAGQTLASGEARAMPFYNPVAGRTIDQLAVDVQSGSAGTGTLYVCTDDGSGYPGAVVASAALSTFTTSTRSAATVSGSTYVLPRGLLWLVAHGTGTSWSGLTLDGQSPLMPIAASYSTGGISCWRVTGAGTSTFTSFPAGGSLSTGVMVSMRAA